MSGKIFINYRRGDDAGFTQALYQRLEDEFTAGNLFMDVEGHIKPGDDFVEVLNAQVAASDVLLVVIGPRWADLLAARAGDPDDFVAIEIKAALDKGKRVIPVLVGGAGMPRAETLPKAIHALARRNAVGLRPERFRADCQGLVTALKEQLVAAAAENAARTDAERVAAEAARRESEAVALSRAAQVEQRAQAQVVAGLGPEEIRKAEELANWQFVEGRGDAGELRDHLARFPGGVTERYAQVKLEALIWAGLGASPDISALQSFLDEFQKGAHAETARSQLSTLHSQSAEEKAAEERRARETAAWGAVAASTEKAEIEAFLAAWPGGEHATAAQARIAELRRGPGSRRRWMLQGAGVTAALVAVVAAGWWGVGHDWSLKVLDKTAVLALKPKDIFKECTTCPEMVVVPAGEFWMGSLAGEKDRSGNEGPHHKVTIAKPVAVGKFAVTFDEWGACVAGGGCNGYRPDDQGWGRGKRPAINVSWNDSTAYVEWLSAKTGRRYRLLSETEWEYAARAGTMTTYFWGNEVGKGNANCVGCGSQWDNRQTAPVGSFPANAFGLHDMHGNVWQWVQDCFHDSYQGAPVDGSAWTFGTSGDCGNRVVRGGSWYFGPQFLRAASRSSNTILYRFRNQGFRVARILDN